MKLTLRESKIPLINIYEIIPKIPPWFIKEPKGILELREFPKLKILDPSTYED